MPSIAFCPVTNIVRQLCKCKACSPKTWNALYLPNYPTFRAFGSSAKASAPSDTLCGYYVHQSFAQRPWIDLTVFLPDLPPVNQSFVGAGASKFQIKPSGNYTNMRRVVGLMPAPKTEGQAESRAQCKMNQSGLGPASRAGKAEGETEVDREADTKNMHSQAGPSKPKLTVNTIIQHAASTESQTSSIRTTELILTPTSSCASSERNLNLDSTAAITDRPCRFE